MIKRPLVFRELFYHDGGRGYQVVTGGEDLKGVVNAEEENTGHRLKKFGRILSVFFTVVISSS